MRGAKPSLDNVIPMKGEQTRRAPAAPEHLDDHAREVWERLAPVLINKGRLEPEYEDTFAAYCVMAGHVVAMSHEVAMMGSWYEVQTRNGMQQKHRASWVQLTQAVAGMNQLAARFGLTPVDEARLKGGAQGDLFADLMRSLDGPD
ncbi:P27 family phage terminase small subunit [Paracoccus aestuariivivens]|uniref:Phage terminase small subunit P27 family n=1 Tax=Paracoccus aestuariivivens TaxID=1820333 RepID=A0A6L6J846_9RHOB|nr:P27 family phage terminase small subunit [Paracoccus aestuariivivens]MTH76324.1 phage terminase small subunit P27 family [Paracoccus aestuariivivens]